MAEKWRWEEKVIVGDLVRFHLNWKMWTDLSLTMGANSNIGFSPFFGSFQSACLNPTDLLPIAHLCISLFGASSVSPGPLQEHKYWERAPITDGDRENDFHRPTWFHIHLYGKPDFQRNQKNHKKRNNRPKWTRKEKSVGEIDWEESVGGWKI